jgi:excisionase family DNA binding protein
MQKLLTPDQVAESLAVCRDTIYGMVRDGRLPAVELKRRLRFRPEDVERALQDPKRQCLTRAGQLTVRRRMDVAQAIAERSAEYVIDEEITNSGARHDSTVLESHAAASLRGERIEALRRIETQLAATGENNDTEKLPEDAEEAIACGRGGTTPTRVSSMEQRATSGPHRSGRKG